VSNLASVVVSGDASGGQQRYRRRQTILKCYFNATYVGQMITY